MIAFSFYFGLGVLCGLCLYVIARHITLWVATWLLDSSIHITIEEVDEDSGRH